MVRASSRSLVTRSQLRNFLMKTAETKYVTGSGNPQVDEANPVSVSMNLIQEGDDVGQRIGNEVYVWSLWFRGYLRWFTTVQPLNPYQFRVIVYIPLDPDDELTATTTVTSIVSKDSFRVLFDKVGRVPWTNSVQGNVFTFKHKFGPFGMKTIYESSAADSITKNKIRFYVTSDAPSSNTNQMFYHYSLYFKDV